MKLKMEESNIYFNPGDVVQIKQDISNKPRMIVIKKITSIFKHDSNKIDDRKSTLKGIKCMWFTKDGYYQENIFNTKDLTLISEA